MANPSKSSTIERLLDAIVDQLTPEASRVVLDLYAPDDVKARIDALVETIMQGGEGLTPAEKDEYDGLMQVVHTISMIQDRIDARAAAKSGAPASSPAPSPVFQPNAGVDALDLDDLGDAPVVPRPSIASAPTLRDRDPGRFEGLEAMLDDLDENLRPEPSG